MTREQALETALIAALPYLPARRWLGSTHDGYWQASGAALLEVREKVIAALDSQASGEVDAKA